MYVHNGSKSQLDLWIEDVKIWRTNGGFSIRGRNSYAVRNDSFSDVCRRVVSENLLLYQTDKCYILALKPIELFEKSHQLSQDPEIVDLGIGLKKYIVASKENNKGIAIKQRHWLDTQVEGIGIGRFLSLIEKEGLKLYRTSDRVLLTIDRISKIDTSSF